METRGVMRAVIPVLSSKDPLSILPSTLGWSVLVVSRDGWPQRRHASGLIEGGRYTLKVDCIFLKSCTRYRGSRKKQCAPATCDSPGGSVTVATAAVFWWHQTSTSNIKSKPATLGSSQLSAPTLGKLRFAVSWTEQLLAFSACS